MPKRNSDHLPAAPPPEITLEEPVVVSEVNPTDPQLTEQQGIVFFVEEINWTKRPYNKNSQYS
jgi:hypothetical protein